jgi:hypothetical protein
VTAVVVDWVRLVADVRGGMTVAAAAAVQGTVQRTVYRQARAAGNEPVLEALREAVRARDVARLRPHGTAACGARGCLEVDCYRAWRAANSAAVRRSKQRRVGA